MKYEKVYRPDNVSAQVPVLFFQLFLKDFLADRNKLSLELGWSFARMFFKCLIE